jgi:hypothetical protein
MAENSCGQITYLSGHLGRVAANAMFDDAKPELPQ